MKLEFEESINGFQEARRLRMLLEHYAHSEFVDTTTALFVEVLLKDLDRQLSGPGFNRFHHEAGPADAQLNSTPGADGFLAGLRRTWRGLFGPSRRELLLSRQRQELIERAERAEAMAFEAFSETANVGRQRDEALRELRRLKSDCNGEPPPA